MKGSANVVLDAPRELLDISQLELAFLLLLYFFVLRVI